MDATSVGNVVVKEVLGGVAGEQEGGSGGWRGGRTKVATIQLKSGRCTRRMWRAATRKIRVEDEEDKGNMGILKKVVRENPAELTVVT